MERFEQIHTVRLNALIIGADDVGEMVLRELERHDEYTERKTNIQVGERRLYRLQLWEGDVLKIAVPWPVKQSSQPRIKEALKLWDDKENLVLCLVEKADKSRFERRLKL